MRVDVVLFDAGGVLVHPDWARVAAVLAPLGAAAAVDALSAAEHAQWAAMDTPAMVTGQDDLRARVFLAGVLARVGIPADAIEAAMPALNALRAEGRLWDFVPADVAPTLGALRARGLRLGVVSNANGKMPAKLARLGLAEHFDTIVDSGLEGIEKPDPRVFHIALERMGAEASRAAFVGDLYHIDVVGARAAGLSPVLLDKADLRVGADVTRVRRLSELLDLLGR